MSDARVRWRLAVSVLGAVSVVIAGGCVLPGDRGHVSPSRTAGGGARKARAAERQGPPLAHPRLQHTTLPSGLRLLLDEDPYATAVGAVSIVAGGSGADPPGAEGLAHLVEHLAYRAVDPPSPGGPQDDRTNRRDRLTRNATVAVNAHTTHDYLIFYEFGPPARLDALLAVATARLANPLVGVDDEAFARERRIVGSEFLFRDDPRRGAWAVNTLFPLLFPRAHPYARSPAGTDVSRRGLTLAQAHTYATQNFRPESMTLLITAPPGVTSLNAIAGKLSPALHGDAARPVARPAPAKPSVQPPAAPPPAQVERRASPLPTPELWIGWRLPGSFGAQGATLDLLARWVQEDIGSDQVAQEEPKLRHVDAMLYPGADSSALLVRALVADGADPDRVARVLVARVASLWAREAAHRETFARFKSLYEANAALDEPSQLPRAIHQAVAAAIGEQVQPMAQLSAALQAVPSTAVAELGYRHLTRERARAVMFTPAPVTSDDGLRSGAAQRPAAESTAPRELVAGAAGWNPSELRELLPAPPAVSVTKLAGGLTVVTAHRPTAAAVAWLAFRGGSSDADPPLLVDMAMRVRPEANAATRLHILPGRGATRDMSFDTVEFLPDRLPEALALLFAKATAPVKEWPSREGLARLLAPTLAAEDASTRKAERDFLQGLFGDHPHARLISADDADRLTRSDVDAWLGRVHTVRNAALIVVGDVDPAAVERAATILAGQLKTPAWVADLPAPTAPIPRWGKDGQLSAPALIVNGRPGTLTQIRLGCLLPSMAAADRGHYEMLAHAIEARLDTALRVEDGDSYGVQMALDRFRDGTTAMVASTYVGHETLSRSLSAIRAHWQRWGREGFDPGEINVARWRYAGSLSLSQGNAQTLAYGLAKVWANEPEALGKERVYPDVVGLRAARVNELFVTCKANAVLALTGQQTLVRRTVEQAWPGLTTRRRGGGP